MLFVKHSSAIDFILIMIACVFSVCFREALQSLQQEVDKLKERLEGSLRVSKLSNPLRVPPNLSEDTRDDTPPQTATPQWLDLRHNSLIYLECFRIT